MIREEAKHKLDFMKIDIMVGDMPAQACDQCNVFYPLAYTGGGHKFLP